VYGRIDNNSVYSFGGGRIAEEPTQWLRDLISRNGTIVTKPVGGSSGDNVRVISHVSKVANMSFPNEATDEALMVMKYVEQADYLNDIYSHSANTVRAITIWDYETGDP
ncbi:hypothetical protein, partial [Aeromonas veronii]|uniref:hypothetical protein n=1 Tax=Aeromonas veronii TaxID=654 RepID=UPI0038B4F30B